MKLRFVLFLLIGFTLASVSCKRDHYKIDVSSVKAETEIKRLEIDLFSPSPEQIPLLVPGLKQKYGSFLQLFSYVINTGDVSESSFGDMLVRFCTDRQNNEIYELTVEKFKDIDKLSNDLNDAFRHYLWYFPERKLPAVYTCITGFNNSIITGDSVLAIGIDRYLGADCSFYPALGIYKYLSDRMTADYIVPDCMSGLASSEWDFSTMHYESDNLLAEMIHNGKLKYFTKCMLPGFADELIFGFTQDQMKFCRNNEDQMWQYLIENDLLFKTDQFIIRKLIGEAPFTTYFTNESPGRAAVWTGFRIVESYMKKNPDITLEELMRNTDIQTILEKAKYNPQ